MRGIRMGESHLQTTELLYNSGFGSNNVRFHLFCSEMQSECAVTLYQVCMCQGMILFT